MRINFAHIRERSTTGGWINFIVFEANSQSNTDSGRADVLRDLTRKARLSGLAVDQSALAYEQNGQLRYYGSPNLVDYLVDSGLPDWTHSFDA